MATSNERRFSASNAYQSGHSDIVPADETTSKDIRYKIEYQNDAGERISEETQYKPWPKLVTSDEAVHTGSVLDIITYVTIRQIAVSTSVNSKDSATDAGAKEPGSVTEQNEDVKKRNLEITSVGSTVMMIRSKLLLEALRAKVEYYPSQQLTGSSIQVSEPYHFLLHHRKELMQMLGNEATPPGSEIPHYTPDQKTIAHIQVLLAFLDAKYARRIEEEEIRHKKSPPTATFEMMWMLLKPGTRVYCDVDGELAAFVVKSAETDKTSNPSYYSVVLWSLEFDGRRIGRCKKTVRITSFSGERAVESLSIHPVSMAHDKGLQQKLAENGEFYFRILRKGNEQINYDGHCLSPNKRYYRGRVVLDPSSYWAYSGTKKDPPEIGGMSDDGSGIDLCDCYDDLDPKDPKLELSVQHFILFPRKIMGFILKSRTWEILDINHRLPFQPNENAIKNLVMDEKHLKMVEVLTYKYKELGGDRNGPWTADFIQSKGEGQIFLLHGPPGVGKTYTAECIAELTRRPLLALTCADIGIDEEKMETTLSSWFELAEIWGAVMLIDEADIYLEIRTTGDLQRNSLVSAFLRSMEYYRGILFLTTNRVGQIDDAIMSRVHLVVRYQLLDAKARKTIWKNFVEKLERDRKDFMVDPRATKYIENYFEDTDTEWNGREIRNAIQTAVALAEHEAKSANPPKPLVELKTTHIKEVIDMSQIFKKYLADFKGDETRRALDARNRNDKDRHVGRENPSHGLTIREMAANRKVES